MVYMNDEDTVILAPINLCLRSHARVNIVSKKSALSVDIHAKNSPLGIHL